MKRKQKSVKQKRTKNKGNSFIVTFFKRIFFVFLAVITLLISLYFFVFPSILSSDNQSKNILIVSDRLDLPSNSIYLAHISGSQTKNKVVRIPSEQSVTVPGDYGEYPLQSVYQLLLIDKKDEQFIKSVFTELLGVTIDDVVTVADSLDTIGANEFPKFFLNEAIADVAKLRFRSMLDHLHMHYATNDVVINTSDSLENFRSKNNQYKTISSDLYQHCSVAVINSTGVNGVARRIGTVIENAGALVIRVGDSSGHEENTRVYVSYNPVNCEQLAESISGIFKEKPEVLPIERLENAQQYRSQVVVIVGN